MLNITDLTDRIATATNLDAQRVTAWMEGSEAWDVNAIEDQMRETLEADENESAVLALHLKGIITDEECEFLNA